MAIIAQGSFSIVDYNDAITLTSFLRTNTAKSVVYDPTAAGNAKYNPTWTASPYCDITPVVTKPKADGTGTDDITTALESAKWSKIQGGVTTVLTWNANATKSTTLTTCSNDTNISFCEYGTAVSSLSPWGIRIKEDKMTTANPAIDYIFEAKYKDPATQLYLDVKCTISFNLFQNGSNIAAARAYAVTSDTFYNAQDTATLQVGCDLLRGTTPDSTISFQWYKMDGTVFAPTTITTAITAGATTAVVTAVDNMGVGGKFRIGSETKTITAINTGTKTVTVDTAFSSAYAINTAVSNPDYDSNAGIGWGKIAVLANYYATPSGTRPASASCNMTVYAIAVSSMQTFKCVIQDTESLSYYSDTVSLFDTSDPIQVELFSPTGNAIRNGQGTVVISATIKRNGTVVTTKTDGTAFTVKYRKLEQDGTPDADFGGAGQAYLTAATVNYAGIDYPNAINVSASNVTKKAVFICEVS